MTNYSGRICIYQFACPLSSEAGTGLEANPATFRFG